MNNIFSADNKLFRGLDKIVDVFYLSILSLILSVPLFTIGAVGAALYYTTRKCIIMNRGYVASTFWESFKSNFKSSTKTWLIQLVMTLVCLLDMYLCSKFLEGGSVWGFMFFLFLVLLLILGVWITYCCCYNARFEQTPAVARKNAGLIAIANLPWSILILVINLAVAILVYVVPITIVAVPTCICLIYYPIMEKIFRKYMSPEDIAREEEDRRIDMADF